MNNKIETIENLRKSIQEDFEKNFYKTMASPDNIEAFKQTLTKRIQEYKLTRGKGPDDSLYYHDCDECLFLGGFLECNMTEENILNACYFDLYAHKSETRLELISRYGDNPSEYFSYSLFYENGCIIPPTTPRISSINEAYKRYIQSEKK
jgi:hypothetical protein